MVEKQIVEMTDENYAIATNNLDKIAFGGIEKKVYLQQVSLDSDQQFKFEGDQTLAMQFDSAVTKLEFVGAKHLLAVSEDSTVQLMDLESGKVQTFTHGRHEGSVRNAAVDPMMDLLATVGCDGNLHINSIHDQSLKRKQSISEHKTHNYKPQAFTLKWSEDGSLLLAAGTEKLTVLKKAASTELEHPLNQIVHDKPITLIEVPSKDVIITVGEDKILKVWNIENGPKLTHQCYLQKDPLQIMYCRRNQMIAVMDQNCSVSLIQLDLADIKIIQDVTEDIIDIENVDMESDVDLGELEDVVSDKPDLEVVTDKE